VRALEEKLAWAEYEAGVRAAGIPVCEWAATWDATPFPVDDEGMLESLREMEAHEKACPFCTARQRYAEQHPPPIGSSQVKSGGLLDVVDALVNRLPEKLRPVLAGVLMYSALAIVLVLVRMARNPGIPAERWKVLLLVTAAAIGGAAGGTAYVATLGRRRQKSGAPNHAETVFSGAVSLAVFMLLIQLYEGRMITEGPAGWVTVGMLTLIIGVGIGIAHRWYRSASSRDR
jgi:uncharacterized membrane protein YozB (DUF420 family)